MALWLPASFVAISVLFLKLIDTQQTPLRVFSLRESAQACRYRLIRQHVCLGPCRIGIAQPPERPDSCCSMGLSPPPAADRTCRCTHVLHSRGIGYKRVVVIGDLNQAMPVITQLSKSGSFYRVAGMVATANDRPSRLSMGFAKDEPTVSCRASTRCQM